MSDFSIQLAHPDDAASFYEVEEDAGALLAEHPSLADIPLPPSRSASDYKVMIEARQCLVATSKDQVIGIAAARRYGQELHLHELSVIRGFQRQGIGATLLNALKIDARNSGIRAITLHTFREIPWNAPFYEREGFVIIDNLDAYPRLAKGQQAAVDVGLPREMRCAMIHFLD